jgi:hypothetical protein
MHKGYKFLDKSTGRIYIYCDVVFAESAFPYATPDVSIDIPTLRQAITFPSTDRLPMIMFVNMTYPTMHGE